MQLFQMYGLWGHSSDSPQGRRQGRTARVKCYSSPNAPKPGQDVIRVSF